MFESPPSDADFWQLMAHPFWWYAPGLEAAIYSWFNVAEALAWWAIAVYVGVRWLRQRRSRFEPLYVFMFVLFGGTDIAESFAVTLWLLLVKGLVFSNLLVLRAYLIRDFYPDAKL